MIDVLTEICNRIWRTGERLTTWTQSLIITFPKIRQLQLCQNCRTISFNSHSSKVMLKVILKRLYDKATSAVQMNGSMGEWFRRTVRVRQGCLLSPTLSNIFLKRIMSDALEEHDGKLWIGSRTTCNTNLQFVDDIVESLHKTCSGCKMEISAEKNC